MLRRVMGLGSNKHGKAFPKGHASAQLSCPHWLLRKGVPLYSVGVNANRIKLLCVSLTLNTAPDWSNAWTSETFFFKAVAVFTSSVAMLAAV